MQDAVRTCASFGWSVAIAEDEESPFARSAVEHFVAALRAAGLNMTPPENQQYVWGFDVRLPHLLMQCQLGLVGGESETWLLACYPRRGWADWWHGRWRHDEQERFVGIVDALLRADGRVSDLRWYRPEVWNQIGR